jgi:hypothetical protein
MVYTVYKVTNKLNGKFYVGVHKTNNPMDGYLGSGEQIRSAVKKYGRNEFVKEILNEFDSSDAAYAREAEIVNAEFVADPKTYNMYLGGFGSGIEVANANGLNNKGKTKAHFDKMRSARKPDVKKYEDQQLLDAFDKTRSVRLACQMLGAGVTGALSRRMRVLLTNKGIDHKSKPGPK